MSPGAIETPILGKLGLAQEILDSMPETIPMKRIGSAEEMAKAALLLASTDSSYIAGAELMADGGKTLI